MSLNSALARLFGTATCGVPSTKNNSPPHCLVAAIGQVCQARLTLVIFFARYGLWSLRKRVCAAADSHFGDGFGLACVVIEPLAKASLTTLAM